MTPPEPSLENAHVLQNLIQITYTHPTAASLMLKKALGDPLMTPKTLGFSMIRQEKWQIAQKENSNIVVQLGQNSPDLDPMMIYFLFILFTVV